MIELRDYQKEAVREAVEKIKQYNWCYLAMEMRTGKTITALTVAQEIAVKTLLFVTKKKAIEGIRIDVERAGFKGNVKITNYEQLHKIGKDEQYEMFIFDEAHRLGSFPKQCKAVKIIKAISAQIKPKYYMFLSGTPAPETLSQIYHQLYILPPYMSPFGVYRNFYAWAKDYVVIKQKHLPHAVVNDYSNAIKEKVMNAIDKYFIKITQRDAWINVAEFKKEYVKINIGDTVRRYISEIMRYKCIKEIDYYADTSAKEMQAIHQLCSGTLKIDGRNAVLISDAKLRALQRICSLFDCVVVFYKYIEEGKQIARYIDTSKHYVYQLQAGCEGVGHPNAKAIVYFNIDFSARTHIQSLQRINYMGREKVLIFYLLSDIGFENDILRILDRKEKYNVKDFYKFKKNRYYENKSTSADCYNSGTDTQLRLFNY